MERTYKLQDLMPSNHKKWLQKTDLEDGSHNKTLDLSLALPGGDGPISLGGDRSSVTKGSPSTAHQEKGSPAAAAAGPPAPAARAFSEAFSPSSTAVANTSQKRAAPAPVVGWPPIRSFRKNLASTSAAKAVSSNTKANEKASEKLAKGLFVKINMDGVPIGRKVNLSAYDGYEKLSFAVDGLFRDLISARNDSVSCGIETKQDEKAITGLLDGSGEFALVYEDNEGDRMLAGDVPWDMFVSTAKRLRVVRSSELSKVSCGEAEGGVRKIPNCG